MSALDLERLAQKLREDPRSLAFVALADGLRKAGRTAEAWAVLRQGQPHHPDLPSARLVLARLLVEEGQAALAVEILLEVVQQDPANDAARGLLARHLVEQGRTAEARVHLRALEMAGVESATGVGVHLPEPEPLPPPDDPFAAAWLVERCLESGDFERALRVARAAHAEPTLATVERVTDVTRAAGGALVPWVEALSERPYRSIPHREAVARALREVDLPLPVAPAAFPRGAMLWAAVPADVGGAT